MPLPNPDRAITEEMQLPARIAYERERRGWSYEGLAQRMTEAGCPIAPSGIYKTEQQGRRVVVEELVGYSRVFGIPVERLLLPADVAQVDTLREAWQAWASASDAYWRAKQAADRADEAAKQAARVLLDEVGDDPFLLEAVGVLRWGDEWDAIKAKWTGRGDSVKQVIHIMGFGLPDPEEREEEQ